MRQKINIKLSRTQEVIPHTSMLKFDELAWNIVDGILYGKGLDEENKEIIIEIGGKGKGDKHLTYQITNAVLSIIEHNLDKLPAVQIVDLEGNKTITNFEHLDKNHTKITWLTPFDGSVTFN